ncbi:hypothetical protein PUR71_34650 [Streptomyces sp. SP17BM10]|uniref:hypothetical protein n=1 Tax=Streptomyces sp. SP17BM10 TaxID=3002530 RepID=UPI002E78F9D5|nr:hypothetical protein [Streptomyces sp. SP17BM10]MEE1788006.1 hypothetical protein [Streptomyces sp. SP17BM10]
MAITDAGAARGGAWPAAGPGLRLGAAPQAGFVGAAALALVLALRAPTGLAVLGLAAFGLLHNVLELRYVAGRFAVVLAGPLLRLLLVLVTGIVVCRLLPPSAYAQSAEILLAYGLLVAASWYGLRSRPPLLAGAVAVLAVAAAGSLSFPAYHFVVLAHLHNVVPLLFLWEWSRRLARGRAAFLALQFTWVLLVPALLLSGLLDGLLAGATGTAGGWTARLESSYTPPAWLASHVGLRFLAVFAFLQTMHYVVWVWFLPRYAPEAAEGFEARVPALRGARAWALGAAAGGVLAVLFAADYAQGRALYAAVASYHAYLEFPVLLMLVLGAAHRGAPVRIEEKT